MATKFTDWNFVEPNLVLGLFVYYFYGLIISRVGSLLLEPFLKMTRFVQFADYGDYVRASKADPKIEILNESNNMYRTLCSVIFTLIILYGYQSLEQSEPTLSTYSRPLLATVLTCIFLFSYRKQTNYIKQRVATSVSDAANQSKGVANK
jgi:hypothetical protein